MQQAIPYRSWQIRLTCNNNENRSISFARESTGVEKLVAENAVIVVGNRGCCMSHVVKRLLLTAGVNPAIYEVDQGDEIRVVDELEMTIMKLGYNNYNNIENEKMVLPAVFIGGKLFGGLDKVMAAHITGELVPILKQAGALWL